MLTYEKIFKENSQHLLNAAATANLNANATAPSKFNAIINNANDDNSKIGSTNQPKSYFNSISVLINTNSSSRSSISSIRSSSGNKTMTNDCDFRHTDSIQHKQQQQQQSNNEINYKLVNHPRHHHYNSKLGRSFSFKLNENKLT